MTWMTSRIQSATKDYTISPGSEPALIQLTSQGKKFSDPLFPHETLYAESVEQFGFLPLWIHNNWRKFIEMICYACTCCGLAHTSVISKLNSFQLNFQGRNPASYWAPLIPFSCALMSSVIRDCTSTLVNRGWVELFELREKTADCLECTLDWLGSIKSEAGSGCHLAPSHPRWNLTRWRVGHVLESLASQSDWLVCLFEER